MAAELVVMAASETEEAVTLGEAVTAAVEKAGVLDTIHQSYIPLSHQNKTEDWYTCQPNRLSGLLDMDSNIAAPHQSSQCTKIFAKPRSGYSGPVPEAPPSWCIRNNTSQAEPTVQHRASLGMATRLKRP